jgi:hypothetical protein
MASIIAFPILETTNKDLRILTRNVKEIEVMRDKIDRGHSEFKINSINRVETIGGEGTNSPVTMLITQ